MWQEAELYETQGLYDHAVLLYETILAKQPENRKAQAKIVQIRFTQKMEETTASRFSAPEGLSPRLALDLGLAYMGMSLYEEALDEFRRALKSSPTVRNELQRYIAICLLRLKKHREAKRIIDAIMPDHSFSSAEKGDAVAEVVDVLMDQGNYRHAYRLLEQIPDELKAAVRNYDRLREELAKKAKRSAQVVEIADEESGEDFSEPLLTTEADAPEEETVSQRLQAELLSSIPLAIPVSYSLDNKKWQEAICNRLSANWAFVDLPEPLEAGDSLLLKIRLSEDEEAEPVWIVSRVGRVISEVSHGSPKTVKAEFVSFLPGGDIILKNFLDKVVRDPSILAEEQGQTAASDPERPTDIFHSLQEQAVKAMETTVLSELARGTELGALDREAAKKPAPFGESSVRSRAEGLPSVRFACECGQVYVLPHRNVGRKGRCGNCGKIMSVPTVDLRPDPMTDLMVGKTIGGCRLLYRIGGGGMGGVFKGHHIALDIAVAVKILYAHLADKDPVFIKRFIREARAAAKLQHPNIVGVMNVGFENGVHYLVMPFVGGGSAAMLLAKLGRFSPEKVLRIAVEIGRALVVAEEHKMLHRDIKPANILFTMKGEARLADLGLAKHYLEAQDVGITQTGIACGTPLYFSPEQAKGAKSLDIRSDIYSLGITLYHLLNGSPPFKGESAYMIFQKHVNDPLPPFDDGTPAVPDSVFTLLRKMTAKNPDERYQSAQELIGAVELITQEMASARNPVIPVKKKKKGLLERLGLKKPR